MKCLLNTVDIGAFNSIWLRRRIFFKQALLNENAYYETHIYKAEKNPDCSQYF